MPSPRPAGGAPGPLGLRCTARPPHKRSARGQAAGKRRAGAAGARAGSQAVQRQRLCRPAASGRGRARDAEIGPLLRRPALGRRARRCRRAARTPGRPRRGRSMPTTKDFKLEVSAAQFAPSAQAPASSSGRRFRCSSAPPSRGCHGCGGAHESAGPDVVCARMQELSKYFHLPEKAVAKELGICLTSLKKVPSDPSFCAPACAPAAVMRSSAVEHARALTGCCVPPCAALPVVWHHSVAIPQGEDGVSCSPLCSFAAAVCCSRQCVAAGGVFQDAC